jgi:hypothetical protein
MDEDERILQELENNFPSLSGSAFSAAFRDTLNAGLSAFVSENGVIYEMFPDGTRRMVKHIEPPTPVKQGKQIRIS